MRPEGKYFKRLVWILMLSLAVRAVFEFAFLMGDVAELNARKNSETNEKTAVSQALTDESGKESTDGENKAETAENSRNTTENGTTEQSDASLDALVEETTNPAHGAHETELEIPEDSGNVIPNMQLTMNTSGVYEVDEEEIFVNRLDGYVLSMDGLEEIFGESFTVNKERMEIGAEFESENCFIQVVRQDMTNLEANTYIWYSKTFLSNNTIDHETYTWKTLTYLGYELDLVEWRRTPLSRVENDKNIYTTLDVKCGNCVFTFLIKTKERIASPLRVLDCFAFTDMTETAASYQMRITKSDTKMDSKTASLYKSVFQTENRFTWGFYFPMTPLNMTPVKEFSEAIGTEIKYHMVYAKFRQTFDPAELFDGMKAQMKSGNYFMVSLQTSSLSDQSNMLYDILDGQYDSFLTDFANAMKDLDGPVLFRLGNEMNGDWCSYSAYHASMDPSLFRSFYSYVKSFFDAAGAENVIWVWNPNEKSYPDFRWNRTMAYFPDEGADVYGLTGYNNGTFYSGEIWRSFSEIYDPLIEDANNRSDIPCMITEFSCAEMGGDKAAWITEMFEKIKEYTILKAAVWWNGYDKVPGTDTIAREYRIANNATYTDLFRKNLSE